MKKSDWLVDGRQKSFFQTVDRICSHMQRYEHDGEDYNQTHWNHQHTV
jgi:hypothetical protein